MKSKLEIKDIPIGEVIPYENNPRTHDKKQIQLLENSITEFDFTNPIIIDESNELLAGHGRLMAAKKLGLETVPSIQIDYLNTEQKRAYRIADNQLTIRGDWDNNLLGLELKDLSDLEFDLSITGFEPSEIDITIEGVNTDEDDGLNDLPEVSQCAPVAQLEDLWQLGNHFIYCGDATEPSSYERLLKNKRVHMVFTDAPYNVPINKHVCGLGKIQHKEFAMATGEMSPSEFTHFLKTVFQLLKSYSINGSLHYLCMDWRHIQEITSAGDDIYDDFKNLCVWNKNNAGMGSMYRSKHELIFVYKHGKRAHINNIELGKYGRYRTNVWDYEGVSSFSRKADLELHPTVKPTELVADAILDSTKRNHLVLDAFLGSGSTVIACEKTGRICYGIELEPSYIDVTIQRWQKYTNQDAIHHVTGETYNQRKKANE